MRLPRMTTRRWMVVVVVASLLLGAFVTLRRAAHFMRLAAAHEALAQLLRSSTGQSADPKGADHNERLAKKYQRAAARPWLAIEPDSE
jgi:hypothetical protein